MTFRAERKRIKVRTGRVHAVSRYYPAKAGTTIKFVCGEIIGFGPLHHYLTDADLLTREEVSCARCAYSLERSAVKERELRTRLRANMNKRKREKRAAAKAEQGNDRAT